MKQKIFAEASDKLIKNTPEWFLEIVPGIVYELFEPIQTWSCFQK